MFPPFALPRLQTAGNTVRELCVTFSEYINSHALGRQFLLAEQLQSLHPFSATSLTFPWQYHLE